MTNAIQLDEVIGIVMRHVQAGVPQDQVVDAFELATKVTKFERAEVPDMDPPIQLLALVLNVFAKTHSFAKAVTEIAGDNPEKRRLVHEGSPTAELTRELLQKALADMDVILAPGRVN